MSSPCTPPHFSPYRRVPPAYSLARHYHTVPRRRLFCRSRTPSPSRSPSLTPQKSPSHHFASSPYGSTIPPLSSMPSCSPISRPPSSPEEEDLTIHHPWGSMSDHLRSPYPYASEGSEVLLAGNKTRPYTPKPYYRRGHGTKVVDLFGRWNYEFEPESYPTMGTGEWDTPTSYDEMDKPIREECGRWLRKKVDSCLGGLMRKLCPEGFSRYHGARDGLAFYGNDYDRYMDSESYGDVDYTGTTPCVRLGSKKQPGDDGSTFRRRCGRSYSDSSPSGNVTVIEQPRLRRRNVCFSNSKRRRNKSHNKGKKDRRSSNKKDNRRSSNERDNKGRNNSNNKEDNEVRSDYKVDKVMENKRRDGVKVYRKNNSNNRSNKEDRSNNRSNKENRSNNRSNKEEQRNKLMQMSDRSLKRIYQELRKNQKLHSSGGRGDRREEERRNEDGWIEDGRMEKRMSKNNSNYTKERKRG